MSILVAKPFDEPEEVKLAKDEEQITDIEDSDAEILDEEKKNVDKPAAADVSEVAS